MTSSYLIFVLAGRRFGARLVGALEILPWRKCRPVPLAYSYVEGLIDYRGTVYPVFNLAQRIGLTKTGPVGFTASPAPEQNAGQSILLLEENKVPFGVIVDSVVKMTMLEEPTPASTATQGVDAPYLKGLVYEDEQEIMILDFERLFHAGQNITR